MLLSKVVNIFIWNNYSIFIPQNDINSEKAFLLNLLEWTIIVTV